MKTLRSIFLFVVFAAAFGALLWFGVRSLSHKGDSQDAAGAGDTPPAEKKPGETEFKMDEETQKRLGLAVESLKAVALKPEAAGYGRVIDPTPLVALDGDLSSAEIALEASLAAEIRAKSLFQSGGNVAQKQLEAAEAQYRVDLTKAQGLRRRMALEWGGAVSQLDGSGRGELIDRLARSESAFVRVDVTADLTFTDLPKSARIIAIGREAQPVLTQSLSPATSVDPKTQAQSFLLRVDHPAFPMRPGTAVTAFLELPGDSRVGVVIPRSAIVYFEGTAWAYTQTGAASFDRRQVSIATPVADGVFVTENFKEGEKIVQTGAQALLSAQQNSGEHGGAD